MKRFIIDYTPTSNNCSHILSKNTHRLRTHHNIHAELHLFEPPYENQDHSPDFILAVLSLFIVFSLLILFVHESLGRPLDTKSIQQYSHQHETQKISHIEQ